MKKNYARKIITTAGLALLAFLGLRAGAAEETTAPPKSGFMKFMEQDYLFGDWGGLRTKLKEKGVDFEFVYFGAVPSNVGGGLKEGSVYEGGLMMLLDLYSDKLAGYEGGQFHVGGLSIHNGPEFSKNFVGDLNKVSMLDFPDTLHLWELWYEQKFWDNKVAIKFGQLAIDRDFIVPEYYNSLAGITLLNQTFFYPTMAFNVYDQPFFPVGNHALASTPYGTPGVRLRVDPCDYAYFQVGAYDGNPDRTRGGVRVKLSNEEGALIYGELTLKINQGKEAKGPPGNLKFGGYYHTDDFVDSYEGGLAAADTISGGAFSTPPPFGFGLITAPARFHEGNYGIYLLADQTLWREIGKDDPTRQGLVGFLRAAYAPPDRNLAWLGLDGGLVYKGLIPARDWDTLALGVSYLEISDDIRRAQRDINATTVGALGPGSEPFTKIADYEAVIELSYKAQITAWWTLQPSIQRVFHPGGRVQANIPDAWAVIIQTTIRF
jgi:porin